jgi:hypothetical protein
VAGAALAALAAAVLAGAALAALAGAASAAFLGAAVVFVAGALAGVAEAEAAGASGTDLVLADLPAAFAATLASRLRPDRAGVDFTSADAGSGERLASSEVAAAVLLAGFAVAWLALVAAT